MRSGPGRSVPYHRATSTAPLYHEHFLTRVRRLGDDAVDRVMRLWYESDAVRDLIARVEADEGRPLEGRFAIQVADGARFAHVIVAPSGGLVTVLGAGMRVNGIDRILPWQAFEDARRRAAVVRVTNARHEALRERYGWATVWRRLYAGPEPGRELMERALADADMWRELLPDLLPELRKEAHAAESVHWSQRFTDGATERPRLETTFAVVHAVRIAGEVQALRTGVTLAEMTMESVPLVCASSAVALARLSDGLFDRWRMNAYDVSHGVHWRRRWTLVLALSGMIREERRGAAMDLLRGLEGDSDVGDVARWLGGRLAQDDPDVPDEWSEGLTATIALALLEVGKPLLEHYLPEEEAELARRAFVDELARMPKTRLDRSKPQRRRVQTVGRNDPCPCGSGKKWKRCCGAAAP